MIRARRAGPSRRLRVPRRKNSRLPCHVAVGMFGIGGFVGEADGIERDGGRDVVGDILEGVGEDGLGAGEEIGDELDDEERDADGEGKGGPAAARWSLEV